MTQAKDRLVLVGVAYSPWTEKARWAVRASGAPYVYQEFTPLISMPKMAMRLKKPPSQITVPVLFDHRKGIMDSWAIARHLDLYRAREGMRPLIPDSASPRWGALLHANEALLDAGRALTMYRMEKDERLLAAGVPAFVPGAMRGMMGPVVRLAIRFLRHDFPTSRMPMDLQLSRMRDAIKSLRKLLESRSSETLLADGFSFADILIATSMQPIKPVDHPRYRLSEGMRNVWSTPELADEAAPLLAYRDEMYAKFRDSVVN